MTAATSRAEPSVRPAGGWPGRSSLFWRVFLLNALVFALGTMALVLTPITVSSPVALTEVLVLAAGFSVLLIANTMLLRWAFAPLDHLRHLMERVDLLRPGQRLPVRQAGEFAPLVHAFNDMLARLEAERQESAARVLRTGEEERRRVAQELHDEVGQTLTAVLLQLKRVQVQAPPAMRRELSEVQETVRGSLDEVRQIVHQLRPGVLQDLGLLRGLDALVDGFAERSGVVVDRRLPSSLPRLDEAVELAVYRIAQESLTNVARHACASRVEVALTKESDRMRLEIADDGLGIAPTTGEGGGIRGMRERALYAAGCFDISSAPGLGTRVTFSLPAHQPAEAGAWT